MRQKKLVPKRRFAGFDGEWEEVSLEDTVDISTNMVDPRDDEYNELWHIGPGNIESFTGKLLDNVMKVKYSNLISGKFHFYKDDIIYGKINPQLAKYTMAKSEGLASADAYVLNSKNNIEQTFLYYVIQTYEFYKYTVSVSSRTGMPKINREELNVYNFNAPSFKEQQKIGHFFNQLDEMIATQQQKVEKTKALKSAYLAEMFPAEGERVPKRRFAGFTEEWEECTLGDIAEVRTGKAFSSTEFKSNGKYLVITNKDISEKRNNRESTANRIDIDDQTALSNYALSGENILVTMDGNVGITAKYSNEKAVLAQRVGRLNSEQIDFVFQVTQNLKFIEEMNKISVGNIIKHISLKQISDYLFMAPIDEEEQQKIGEFFKQLDEKITNAERKLDKLKAMKQAYLQEMFV